MREFYLKRRLIALYNRLQDDYFDFVRKHEKETDTKAAEYWYDKASVQAGIMDGVAKAASEALGIRSDDFLLLCYRARDIRENTADGAGEEYDGQRA